MNTLNLDTLHLLRGSHGERDQGVCLLEAVAWFAGQTHTDHPPCVSPVLGSFGRSLNDILPDAMRQQLIPFVPLLPGTAGDGRDEARGYMALDWLIRTWLPGWLDLAGLDGESRALRAHGRVDNLGAAQSIGPLVLTSRDKAVAAGAAARDAAEAAARAAAGDALHPTLATLQDSAIRLYHRMIRGHDWLRDDV